MPRSSGTQLQLQTLLTLQLNYSCPIHGGLQASIGPDRSEIVHLRKLFARYCFYSGCICLCPYILCNHWDHIAKVCHPTTRGPRLHRLNWLSREPLHIRLLCRALHCWLCRSQNCCYKHLWGVHSYSWSGYISIGETKKSRWTLLPFRRRCVTVRNSGKGAASAAGFHSMP